MFSGNLPRTLPNLLGMFPRHPHPILTDNSQMFSGDLSRTFSRCFLNQGEGIVEKPREHFHNTSAILPRQSPRDRAHCPRNLEASLPQSLPRPSQDQSEISTVGFLWGRRGIFENRRYRGGGFLYNVRFVKITKHIIGMNVV